MYYQLQTKLISSQDKLVTTFPKDIALYYFSLIPKYYNPQKPRYDFHITVCRTGKETAKPCELVTLDQRIVNIKYVPIIQMDKIYFWLNVFSLELEQIRVKLGLKLNPYGNTVYPPFSHIFHMTIGNRKWQKAS